MTCLFFRSIQTGCSRSSRLRLSGWSTSGGPRSRGFSLICSILVGQFLGGRFGLGRRLGFRHRLWLCLSPWPRLNGRLRHGGSLCRRWSLFHRSLLAEGQPFNRRATASTPRVARKCERLTSVKIVMIVTFRRRKGRPARIKQMPRPSAFHSSPTLENDKMPRPCPLYPQSHRHAYSTQIARRLAAHGLAGRLARCVGTSDAAVRLMLGWHGARWDGSCTAIPACHAAGRSATASPPQRVLNQLPNGLERRVRYGRRGLKMQTPNGG